MQLLQRISDILFKPKNFFSYIDKEKGLQKSFFYFSILQGIYTILTTLVIYYWPRAYTILFLLFFKDVPVQELLKTAIIGFLSAIVLSFIISGIIFGWLRLFKGKRPYYDAYKLYAYSSTPSLVFGWIPIVSFFTWIYSLVVLIIGTHVMYKMSSLKSTLIYIIPLAMLLILFVIITIFATFAILLAAGGDSF